MTSGDCGPGDLPNGLPSWARTRNGDLWTTLTFLAFLIAEPIARATEAKPAWPSFLGLAVICLTYLGAATAGHGRIQNRETRPVLVAVLLTVQTVTTVAVVARSPESAPLFPLLAIAVVIALDATWGLRLIPVVTVFSAVVTALVGAESGRVTAIAVTTVLSGFGCWSLRHLFILIAELNRTREELARVAVARERERFSRDLHDLLGHTLSVIVVKAQAVRRLATVDGEAAAAHGADIEAVGRRALTEVRQAVAGYRGTGLAAELDRAREALAAAGIAATVSVPESGTTLPPEVDALFGWVVREGVTNVVRHSGARRCVVTWSRDGGAARLEVTDDGPGPAAPGPVDDDRDGFGLAGLRDRVAVAGGRLVAGPAGDGFGLSVEVPVAVPQEAAVGP